MGSKKYDKVSAKIDKTKVYPVDKAIEILTSNSSANFDETIEIHAALGINPDKSGQQIRGSIVLPNGGVKDRKIAAFVTEDNKDKAEKAGADLVGGEDLIDDIKKNKKCDFDVAVAEPEMMEKLGKIARVLGPRGLMPTPKNGTVTENVEETIEDLKSGKIFFRNDSGGNIHAVIGKTSWDEKEIKENFEALISKLKKLRPSKVDREDFFKKVALTSTMGPSIKVEVKMHPDA